MNTEVALVEMSAAETQEFAGSMNWHMVHAIGDAESTWRSNNVDAVVTFRQIDPKYFAIVVKGSDSKLMISDLSAGLELFDDVDVMDEIAAAETSEALAEWARRLGSFAAGEFQHATFEVLNGLLRSERTEFVVSTLRGLQHARWHQLNEPLALIAVQHADLAPLCEEAIASIAA